MIQQLKFIQKWRKIIFSSANTKGWFSGACIKVLVFTNTLCTRCTVQYVLCTVQRVYGILLYSKTSFCITITNFNGATSDSATKYQSFCDTMKYEKCLLPLGGKMEIHNVTSHNFLPWMMMTDCRNSCRVCPALHRNRKYCLVRWILWALLWFCVHLHMERN